MGKYFGTDGIRGTYGDACINPDFAFRLGVALARYLLERHPDQPLNVVIGQDTRASGVALTAALTSGLNQHGVYVHHLGVVPTPAVALSVVEQQHHLGIAVTASHNPATDNGIKLFNGQGFKFSELEEAKIEALVDAEAAPTAEQLEPSKAYPVDGADHYINYISSLLDQNCLQGWKIVLDLANGATCKTTPAVFRRWGAQTILIGDQPDGDNINLGVGSEHPDKLGKAVVANTANLGIAHDGDGDRLVVCDESGTVVDGDILLALFGVYALGTDTLKAKTLVATIQSNLGLDHAIRDAGGFVERTDVGDRNVAMCMRERGANVGGENSGHIIFSDFATTGDGLLAALKVIELMCKTGKKLSTLREEITLFPQMTLNLRVVEKIPLAELSKLPAAIAKLETDFGADGRVLIRYSGTEPKLRMLVEGKDEKVIAAAMKALETAARAELEVLDPA